MTSATAVLNLLREAEPACASGTYVETVNGAVDRAIVFAYRKGGAWALLCSVNGMRVSDGQTLWTADRGCTEVDADSAHDCHHSGSLRDMLVPRFRDFVKPDRRDAPERLHDNVESVETLGRPAFRVRILGNERCPDWVVDVDASSGVVLADQVTTEDGERFERTFLTLDTEAMLPDGLFDWDTHETEE